MKKLLLLLVMLLAINVNAQWVELGNGMIFNDNITCIVNKGSVYFASSYRFVGTSLGSVYRSTDNCATWQTSLDIRSFSLIIVGNNIFAGTYETGVYVSSNNGDNWTQTSLNNKTVTSFAVSGNYIFAGTSFSGIYVTTNDGISWTQTSMTNNKFRCFAVDGNNIFAGGSGVHFSSNNGSNWSNLGLNQEVYSLLIVGDTIFAGTWSDLYISNNYGINWVRQNVCFPYVSSIVKLENNIFIGGSDGVFLTTNNGLNWRTKNQGFGYNPPTLKSLLIANNYIFAGDVGSTWRRNISEILDIQNISTETPSKYTLSQNYPNPFNPSTKIKFELPKAGLVKISVFDVTGREVAVLVNETLQEGVYETTFDASGNSSGLTSGVYFCRMEAGGFSETQRMVLIK